MRLKDKVIIVTGGSHGLGRAFVEGFSAEGASVVIASHVDLETSRHLAETLQSEGRAAMAVGVDVSDEAQTLAMARATVARFGRIDVLVNNAAVFIRNRISKGVPFHELSLEEWDRVMAVNVKGPFLCSRAVFPHMKQQGAGKIINISSGQFHKGGGNVKYAHYVASKGAVIGLTRALARELGEYGIRVNSIAPGVTYTEDESDQVRLVKERLAQERCLKRIEYARDVVGTAVFLASAESDFMTGQTIVVDGGVVLN
jgi:3-oxoacyl-[acyl-carrier protein] reductase